MWTKIKRTLLIISYLKLMGFSWTFFRIKYEIKKRTGYFNRLNNKILLNVSKINFSEIKLPKLNFEYTINNNRGIIEKAESAIHGKIYSFSSQYLDFSKDELINWHINPVTKEIADSEKEWQELPDFGKYGDIKLIWEASRFPQVFHFISAYEQTKDSKYPKACLSQISDWIDKNPYPKGINYKCGQEISIRLIAWIFAIDCFNQYIDSNFTEKFLKNIYTSLLRIDANIDYAAKSVKNNHSISEAAGLFLGGILFPNFPESSRWKKKGIDYLLKEVKYQIYNDGSYIQHSMTYSRLTLDMLSFVILIAKKRNYNIPAQLKEKHEKLIIFLHSFIQENGYLPNYGSNDGANLFPLALSNYRDFRPSLNFAKAISSNEYLYESGKEIITFTGIEANKMTLTKKIKFDIGGYYILKNKNIFAFIRCHTYKHRPSQNDMLHLDIWFKGENVFHDSGTFSYNTNGKLKNHFIGVVGHNTVQIDNENHMQSVLNFGLANWTKSKVIKYSEESFLGEHYAYLDKLSVTVGRQVELKTNGIVVYDTISGINKPFIIRQIWNTSESFKIINELSAQSKCCIINSNIEIDISESYCSDSYNMLRKNSRINFSKKVYDNFVIKTEIYFR